MTHFRYSGLAKEIPSQLLEKLLYHIFVTEMLKYYTVGLTMVFASFLLCVPAECNLGPLGADFRVNKKKREVFLEGNELRAVYRLAMIAP